MKRNKNDVHSSVIYTKTIFTEIGINFMFVAIDIIT